MSKARILVLEAALALLLNITAGLFPRPVAITVTKWGWFLFLLHLTYTLGRTERCVRCAERVRASFGRFRVGSYIAAGLCGAALGLVYWYGISTAFARMFSQQNEASELRLVEEPVVHVEPENELIWSTKSGETVGEYHLTLSNTGPVDIDHIEVVEDYFVALKLQGGIIIKNIGGVPVQSGAYVNLSSRHSCQLLINFVSNIEVMNEVAKNNGVPSMRGVRLAITFRRKADGKDFRLVRGYGVIGHHAEGLFPPGIPQDRIPVELRTQFLSMSEVSPVLDLQQYWTSVVHEIGQDSQGNITSRYH
jgi:hypothetical protein